MKNIFNKTNAPYLASGALAIGTLLASGIFAVAPYVGFLAPVAALSLGLPFVIGGAVFSVAVIALSYKAIGKNNTISEKDAQLTEKAKEIEGKKKENFEQKARLAGKNTQISSLEEQLINQAEEIEARDEIISEKDAQLAGKDAEMQAQQQENSGLKGQVTNLEQTIAGQAERINKQDQDVLRMRCELAATKRNSVKQMFTRDVGVQAQECKDSDVHMPSAKSARNWIPSLKTVGLVAGGAGLLVGGGVLAANGGFSTAGNLHAVAPVGKDVGDHISNSNLSSICPNPTDQQIMQIQIDEAAEKLASTEEFAKNNFGIPNNYSESRWYKDLYKSEDLEKIMEDVPSLFCEGGNSSDYQFAKPNSTESTYTKSSKTVGSNQAAVAGHSRVDMSGACPANYETSLAKRNMDDTHSIFTRIWNKLPSISSLNPFGSRKAVESNQTALATMHSSVDTSGTCPVDSYTALAEYNSSGTCPSQGVCPNEREHFNIADSNIASSNYQFTKQNANEQTCTGASNETGLDQTTIPKEEGKRCDIPDNQFFSRVDNSISTSRQRSTLVNSIELEELTRKFLPSTYLNGSPRGL